MKMILTAFIALFIIAVGYAQLAKKRGETVINDKEDMEGEFIPDSSINISKRLKNNKGASVFGGKFKHTTVVIHKQPGSHTLYATGMNGKLTNLYAIDLKGNTIGATYSTKAPCKARITIEDGRQHCYEIDCSDLPMPKMPKAEPVN